MKESLRNFTVFIFSMMLMFVSYIPTIRWMIDRWNASESYYSHGFLIPLVSLYIAWQRREIIRRAKTSLFMPGLALITFGLIAHLISASLRVYFVSGISMVIVISGMLLFFFGKEVAKALIFPVVFLLAMVPLPLVVVGNLTVALKLFAARCSAAVLNRIGFPCMLDGNIIIMPGSHIAIEAPCSGLRSLIALLTLGLIFAFAMKASYFRKAVLLIAAMPIALIANMARIITLAVVNDLYGEKAALGFFHDLSGFLVFVLAFIGLLAVSRVLEDKGGEDEK